MRIAGMFGPRARSRFLATRCDGQAARENDLSSQSQSQSQSRSRSQLRPSLSARSLVAPAVVALAGFATTAGAVVALGPDIASAADTAYPLALATSSQPASFTGPGQTLTISYLITNNGSRTLYGVAVQDALVGLSPVVCPDGPLTAGTSKTCTATYVTTQADFDRAYLTDVATASGILESVGTLITSPPANLTIPDDKPSTPLAATEPAAEPDPAPAAPSPKGPEPTVPADSVATGQAAEAGPVASAADAPAGLPADAPAAIPAAGPAGAGGGPVGAGGGPVGAGAAPAGVSPVGANPVQVTG